MSKITLRQAAAWCGGHVEEKYEDICFLGANMDSRKLEPGQLFVALEAERDGHAYIGAALEKGAAAVLCSRKEGDFPAIVVENPKLAMGQIAHGERMRLGMQVVGVTGSVGKSTTKEMIACVLQEDHIVSKTPANFNNDLGMPMAILAMPEDTQIAVLEMGMSDFGEISYLSKIGRPQVAVITNIGTMHMEHLGSRQGILQAKLEILEGLDENGPLLLNGDDDLLWAFGQRTERPIYYFGCKNDKCDLFAYNIVEKDGILSLDVRTSTDSFRLELPLEGLHFVNDALAAVGVGLALGISRENICKRLRGFQNMQGRQEIFQAKGYTIINDCYNAGPESMAAALRVLGKRQGRRIAVLGDMLELGSSTQAEHYRVGRIAAENADMVMAYGPNAHRIVSGALTGGLPAGKVHDFDDQKKMAQMLKCMACPGDVILFKGSRGMHMEKVLELLLKDET